MSTFWHLIVSAGIVGAGWIVVHGRSALKHTTLMTAWIWSVFATMMWATAWFADLCANSMSTAVADHAWYAASVLALCPPMAVLGSRRPGIRVWAWFILFPMLLALGWPLIALRLQGSELRGLHLETPQVAAFTLILVMSIGNYLGTRFTISALIYGTSILAIVVSSWSGCPAWLTNRATVRFWSTFLNVLAIFMMWKSSRPVAQNRFDRLWFDFFDTFGIVWGRRIQDRVNFIASKENWPSRLELDGFVWSDESEPVIPGVGIESANLQNLQQDTQHQDTNVTRIESRVEYTFRWLLRRFVDPAWIDERLGVNSQPQDKDLPADS